MNNTFKTKRDQKWLENILFDIWENNFNDVPRKNLVIIKFGRKSENQLGCIRMADNTTAGIKKKLADLQLQDVKTASIITITKYFEDEAIPEYVVWGTIAHELCHYAHGFNSPLKQLYSHPHKGGVIRKELTKRGLGQLDKDANKWLRANWRKYVKTQK